MKKLFYLSIIIFISSCGPKLVKYKLTIIQGQNLGFEEGTPLKIKSLINYIDGNSIIFVPDVKVIREDLTPKINEPIQVPLSKLNEWRKSIDMLPVQNIIDDYDQNIPKLTTPKILSINSNDTIDVLSLKQKYPDAILLNVDSTPNQLNDLQKNILELLNKKHFDLSIILYREFSFQQIDTTNAHINKASKKIKDSQNKIIKKIKVTKDDTGLNVTAELTSNGTLICNASPFNPNYIYSIQVSNDPNFQKNTRIIPLNNNNKISYDTNGSLMKEFRQYSNLYFKFFVSFNNVQKVSNVIGPAVIACIAQGNCQILLKKN